jgi:hypothetical protein
LLLAKDYLSNLVAYRRTIIQEIGCLRTGDEGAEFHDLALRATVMATSDRIRHVPAILYHRRDADEKNHSVDRSPDVRAIAASRRAVRDHSELAGGQGSSSETSATLAPTIPTSGRRACEVNSRHLLVWIEQLGRSVFFEVGGLDEINLPVVCNDVDLCLRVDAPGIGLFGPLLRSCFTWNARLADSTVTIRRKPWHYIVEEVSNLNQ